MTKQSRFAFVAGETDKAATTYNNRGYEIHMGQTSLLPGTVARPVAKLEDGREDGYYMNDRCWGSYLHGILDNPEVLDRLAKGLTKDSSKPFDYEAFKEEQYDKLADLYARTIASATPLARMVCKSANVLFDPGRITISAISISSGLLV